MGVVVDFEGFQRLPRLLLLVLSIAHSFDLGFALAVGGFGFLEDADEVLALQVVSTPQEEQG